jgi:hypothetical protein
MATKEILGKTLPLLLLLVSVSCGGRGTDVIFYSVDGHHFSRHERSLIGRIADDAARDVRKLLPALPARVTLRIEAGTRVIPETGETASAHPPDVVYWTVDARRPEGISAIASRQLRATLFHEFYHLVRESKVPAGEALMDRIVSEGLATVFERDFAHTPVPWGDYPPNVEAWAAEVLALEPGAARDEWMGRHPDGRRWIGYKVGTFFADRAVRRSGRSVIDLVWMPAAEIVEHSQGVKSP